MGPIVVASRTPVQAFAGCGSRQRRLPTGGCAKGIFLNSAPPFDVRLPRSWPVLIVTIGSDPAALAGGKACAKHRTQLKVPSSLMDFTLVPSLVTDGRNSSRRLRDCPSRCIEHALDKGT